MFPHDNPASDSAAASTILWGGRRHSDPRHPNVVYNYRAPMGVEINVEQPEWPGLVARIKRAWSRDSHLGIRRRIYKGLHFALQLARARIQLKACDRVGANPRVAGRMRVDNFGSIIIGDHVNINSSWVPTELVTGREGRIEIGHDVLVNFGTVIAAASKVTIGSGSMIGPHCIISDVDIPEAAAGLDAITAKPIEIGKEVWLAGRVTVRPGVKIGDGAVVVAGSIVESDVPAHVMASGIPARSLPKLGAPGRPVGERRPAALEDAWSIASVPASRESAAPRLRGNLISDFNLEELANELRAPDLHPALDAVVAPCDRFPQSVTEPPPIEARDFAVLWTRPGSAVPSFAGLLTGHAVDEQQVLADVDAFCTRIDETAARYRYVFLPTWTLPSYRRGTGALDSRPGGVLPALAAMNLRLMTRFGRSPNVFVLDAARWLATVGAAGSNPRAWYLGNMAMARPLVAEAALDIRAAVAAMGGRLRNLLVLGRGVPAAGARAAGVNQGAVAGADGVRDALTDFQRVLLDLEARGVTLARIGAGDEAAEIAALSARLGVGLDSIVYIDAQLPARTRVRTALPAVFVPDWPEDKLLYPSALQGLRCFDRAPGERASAGAA
jgi:acetyltransferase-like isoleucine patch superfamily enzyme